MIPQIWVWDEMQRRLTQSESQRSNLKRRKLIESKRRRMLKLKDNAAIEINGVSVHIDIRVIANQLFLLRGIDVSKWSTNQAAAKVVVGRNSKSEEVDKS
mmetsp:Transcript_9563/g.14348  ORF Transcript_9563/g.14348 Transcript_9563/m.14348 type:complete len:100 (+) Transcript_9563:985-1284(+)